MAAISEISLKVCRNRKWQMNKCVSKLASPKSHHMALRDGVVPIPTAPLRLLYSSK